MSWRDWGKPFPPTFVTGFDRKLEEFSSTTGFNAAFYISRIIVWTRGIFTILETTGIPINRKFMETQAALIT